MSEQVSRAPDVSCEHRVRAITDDLTRLPGVEDVDVDLRTTLVTVRHGGSVSDAQLREGIAEAGYDVAA